MQQQEQKKEECECNSNSNLKRCWKPTYFWDQYGFHRRLFQKITKSEEKKRKKNEEPLLKIYQRF